MAAMMLCQLICNVTVRQYNIIAAISWLPPLISHLFHTSLFLKGCTFFTAWLDILSFCIR